jgi:hypothetical protein
MDERYIIAKRAAGWAVLDGRTARVVVLGDQAQEGLSAQTAQATARCLNSFGDVARMTPVDIEALLRGRPFPRLAAEPRPRKPSACP